jgi:hypothetical protein
MLPTRSSVWILKGNEPLLQSGPSCQQGRQARSSIKLNEALAQREPFFIHRQRDDVVGDIDNQDCGTTFIAPLVVGGPRLSSGVFLWRYGAFKWSESQTSRKAIGLHAPKRLDEIGVRSSSKDLPGAP